MGHKNLGRTFFGSKNFLVNIFFGSNKFGFDIFLGQQNMGQKLHAENQLPGWSGSGLKVSVKLNNNNTEFVWVVVGGGGLEYP